jgi:copper chaperone CopZ
MRKLLLIMALAVATVCSAQTDKQEKGKSKELQTVVLTTNPEMHCDNCEKKIKDNIRFEKGIKSIDTNLEKKTVTIKYDADKTSVDAIIEGFKKIKYEAKEVKPEEKEEKKEKE